MRPLLFVAAAALVFAAPIGSASAEDQFATSEGVSEERFDTLTGVPVVSMDPDDLDAISGTSIFIQIRDANFVSHNRAVDTAAAGGRITVSAISMVQSIAITAP